MPASASLRPAPGVRRRRLADGLGDLAQRGRDLQQRLVLALERVEGVAGRGADRLVALERVGEHLHVHVAEPLDVVVGHAALDELLLHGGDLGGLDVLDQLLEARLDLVGGLAGVQVGDDGAELLEARRVDGVDARRVGDAGRAPVLRLDLGGQVVASAG